VLAGPITGFAVSALGWPTFFLSTMVVGVPGLMMLGRFVPLGVREPDFEIETLPTAPATTSGLLGRGIAAGAVLAIGAALVLAVLDAMETMRATPAVGFDFSAALWRLSDPADVGGWLQLVGIMAFAVVGGMFIAATRAKQA